MYVANCTKQVRDFHYRVPESGVRMQKIEIGRQIEIAGDLSQPDVDAIIAQHAVYGMKSVEDARKVRGKFTGLCYSIGKPVSIESMQIVLTKNDDVLTERGQQLRTEAAVATSAAITQGGQQGLKSLETSIVEVKKDGGEPDVTEGVRVDSAAPEKTQVVKGAEAKAKLKTR